MDFFVFTEFFRIWSTFCHGGLGCLVCLSNPVLPPKCLLKWCMCVWSVFMYHKFLAESILLGEIALAQMILFIATNFSVACCVMCHTRAACLNCFTDLDAIWQVHWWGLVTHCVRRGSLNTQGKERFEGLNLPAKTCNCLLMSYQGAALIVDFAFYQITSVTCYFLRYVTGSSVCVRNLLHGVQVSLCI